MMNQTIVWMSSALFGGPLTLGARGKLPLPLSATPVTAARRARHKLVTTVECMQIVLSFSLTSLICTLGFHHYLLLRWGRSHRLDAGTRSQAGRKHLGTTMLGREPTTPSSRAEVTGLNEPSQSFGLWCKTMSLDMAISFMNIAGQPHPHARARMLTTASRWVEAQHSIVRTQWLESR